MVSIKGLTPQALVSYMSQNKVPHSRSDERLKKESNNNRQLINSLKKLNPMSAAENVLSMRKISHGANKIKNIRENKEF